MISGVLEHRTYTDAEIEAAVEYLCDPKNLEDAQRLVAQAAPGLQRILNSALEQAEWFGSAHAAQLDQAVGEPEVHSRLAAVRTLLAEETRLSMLVGVAVGYELAQVLSRNQSEN